MGRHKKTGKELCPSHGTLGFSYTVVVKNSTGEYFYPRFRHNDRTLEDHYIDNVVKEPLKHATEYNRTSNQVTSIAFKPHSNIEFNAIKHRHSDNAGTPIIIYNVCKIPTELEYKIKKIAITDKEKDWLLNSEPVKMQYRVKDFYNEVLTSGIVTFGEKALEYGQKINETDFNGNVIYQMDKFGMLGEVLKIRNKNKKISKSCTETYNYPASLLT